MNLLLPEIVYSADPFELLSLCSAGTFRTRPGGVCEYFQSASMYLLPPVSFFFSLTDCL